MRRVKYDKTSRVDTFITFLRIAVLIFLVLISIAGAILTKIKTDPKNVEK
jgi:hypothetical protein